MRTLEAIRTDLMSNNLTTALNALKEIVDMNGNLRVRGEFVWNCRLSEVWKSQSNPNTYGFLVYWQGDSTDGDCDALFSDIIRCADYRDGYVIPAKSYFDGYRTRYDHSDLYITKEMVLDYCKKISNYFSNEEIEKRRIADEIREKKIALTKATTKVMEILACKYEPNYYDSDSKKQKYRNGKNAVKTLIDECWEMLEALSQSELENACNKVFANNYKIDKEIPYNYDKRRDDFNLAI